MKREYLLVAAPKANFGVGDTTDGAANLMAVYDSNANLIGYQSFDDFVTDRSLGLSLYAENPVTETTPSATGDNAIAMGSGANAPQDNGIVWGNSAVAHAATTDSIVIGTSADANNLTALSSIVIGKAAAVDALNTIAIGTGALAGASSGTNAIAIGTGAEAVRSGGIAIGVSADAEGDNSIAIGQGVVLSGTAQYGIAIGSAPTVGTSAVQAIAIGRLAGALGVASIAIGGSAQTHSSTPGAIAIGFQANTNNANADEAIAIGQGADATGAQSIAIGHDSTASGSQSIAIGHNAAATGANQVSIGSTSSTIGLAGVTTIGGGTSVGALRFLEASGNGTNYVGFQAPSAIAANVTWTLPDADATVSGQALISNAAGTLSWGHGSGDTVQFSKLGIGNGISGSDILRVHANNAGGTIWQRLSNSNAASSAVGISFDPSSNGIGVRDAQIIGSTNGSNQITLGFYTANGDVPVLRFSLDPSGTASFTGAEMTIAANTINLTHANPLLLNAKGEVTGNAVGPEIRTTFSGESGGTAAVIGSLNHSITSGANPILNIESFRNQTEHQGSGLLSNLRGILADVHVSSSGDVSTGWGIWSGVRLLGSGDLTSHNSFIAGAPGFTSTGAIATIRGLHIENLGNSLVTTALGVSIADFTNATTMRGIVSELSSGTGKHNLYLSGSADNYIEGDLGIGDSSPDAKLHVVGTVRIADSGNTDYAELSHDGTDFNIAATNTTDINVTGAKVVTAATTTTQAGLNIPHGTAPSSPVDGDIWTTTAGLFVRINGSTIGPLT